jgi:uncharacterized cupin superfamily protein
MEPTTNIVDIPLRSWSHGERFAAASGEFGVQLGLFGLGAALYTVPPGKSATPFHRHHTSDELFFILAGSGTYRFGEKRLPVKAGDLLGAPAGGEAHQLINTGSDELRYLAFSNNTNADVVEYVDSGRIRVDVGASGHHRENATFAVGGKHRPTEYWEGEELDSPLR